MKFLKLKIKIASLAQEARYIRRQEQKLKKWKEVVVIQDVPFGDNYAKDLQERKWEVKLLPCPQGRKGMTEEERKTYREQVWKYRARLRKLNRGYNDALRESIYRHRLDVVRPASRLAQLALGYLSKKPYRQLETYVRREKSLTRFMRSEIWRMITRFGSIEDTEANKKAFEAWFDPPPHPSPTEAAAGTAA